MLDFLKVLYYYFLLLLLFFFNGWLYHFKGLFIPVLRENSTGDVMTIYK